MVNIQESGEQLDRLFMALADRSRRHIVSRLAENGEQSIGDASRGLELSPAGVSKHVKVLEDAGLVSRRLDGRKHVLSLESGRLLLAEDWIGRYRTIWGESISRLSDLAEQLEADDRSQR